jgi:hypothetical protein
VLNPTSVTSFGSAQRAPRWYARGTECERWRIALDLAEALGELVA